MMIRSSLLVLAALGLGAAMISCSPAPERPSAPPLEAFKPDYSNFRGLNYIASWAPSDVAMWRNYDGEKVERELGYIRAVGANNVRVWLAWVVYDVEQEKFIDKFRDFLSRARAHGLTVMPILWDSCFGDEYSRYDDLTDWVANPGSARVKDAAFLLQGDQYVRAVVEAAKGDPTVAMWDIMNEPSGEGINEWLEHYARLVKSLDPERPLTIGWAHAKGNEVSAAWVDVLSYHPYGIFDKNRELWTQTVREIASRHGNKPILANETGGPGFFMPYEEQVAFFAPRGIGFSLFEASIGSTRFKNVQGFFYSDGTIRDREGVSAFMEHARKQGANVTFEPVVKKENEAGNIAPPGPKAGQHDVARILRQWDELQIDSENLAYYTEVVRWTMVSLAWGDALGEHIEQAKAAAARLDKAKAENDLATAREILTTQAKLALRLATEKGFLPEERPISEKSGS